VWSLLAGCICDFFYFVIIFVLGLFEAAIDSMTFLFGQ
jgi:hypothetical protein